MEEDSVVTLDVIVEREQPARQHRRRIGGAVRAIGGCMGTSLYWMLSQWGRQRRAASKES